VNAVTLGVWQDRPVIISGSSDRTVRVWDLDLEGHAAMQIELQYWAQSIVYTAGRLVIGTRAELLRIDLL